MNTKTENNKAVSEIAAKPGYVFAFIAELGNGQSINITGNMPIGATRADFDSELDKLRGATNRIQAQASIPAIEQKIYQLKKMQDNIRQQMADLDERNKTRFAGKNMPDNEVAARSNLEVDIRAKDDQIAYEEKLLEKTRKEAE